MSAANSPTANSPAADTRRRGKRMLLLSVAGLLGAAVAAAAILLAQPPQSGAAGPAPIEIETALVGRGDLTELVRVQGTLAYSAPRDLGTVLPGIVTGLPSAGSVIAQGGELFRVDDSPVVLLHGELPVWRAFSAGMTDGADVLQLERSLAALGFFEREPDEEFAGSTEAAIERWQKSLGLEQTGMVELGRIAFAPADLRIREPQAAIGDAAGAAIVSTTGTATEVLAFVDTANQDLVAVGASVSIALPGGAQTTGTVVAAGAPVEREGTSGKTMKIPVSITLDDTDAAAALDNVSVSVLLTQTKAADTLLLPVGALLAQPGGGFAVEVVRGAAASGPATTVVPVTLGAFADGLVAVTGGTLAEGDTVVVAK
ncbi:peptidoglycan-binding protein [Microterricola viridarii]|uniref:Multidrug efflux pump subunit AcrA (Membrane-fusion protein) n=1 Tax=Microterricola viridarii TaxID=412690 RepID=A0A1H1WER2_9MICO|nr:peptidoglycan-binding protein [Microterricola viridarii]SDS95150.1 Multidrug efflux pump subunit AcrA (membrane-fusion protein) [Microterricola viridarii]